MKQILLALVALAGLNLPTLAQTAPDDRLLIRRYKDGGELRYLMKGHDGRTAYEVRLTSTVKKNDRGGFFEEHGWSDQVVNGVPRPLQSTSQAFRLASTLEGETPFVPPDLSKAPGLIGPVTDLMTFCADLFLAMHGGMLRKPGDHFQVKNAGTGSWADGNIVILGEDEIVFDITLKEANPREDVAVLLIKHLPPAEPKVRLNAEWMRLPVADTPNNWVEVRKIASGFAASVGKETFDVELRVALSDGKILSATMDNPVTKITRDCSDAALTQCGEARQTPVFRRVEMMLVRE